MSGSSQTISAADLISQLKRGAGVRGVDVRSEGEFEQGSLPAFTNVPILNNSERAQVGISYKKEGQGAAIKLGHSLVDGHRELLVQRWAAELREAELPVVACWRGGLRSEIARTWITEAGISVQRVEGGYKAVRRELLGVYEKNWDVLVLAGPTGSGKTKLLESLACPKVNLEELAVHRGSAFGAFLERPQPAQATFENHAAFALGGKTKVLIEDESLMIGRIHLPPPLREKMQKAAVVRLLVPVEKRAENILEEYVTIPLANGVPAAVLREQFLRAVINIQSRLGGELAGRIRGQIELAFAQKKPGLHTGWIRDLLIHYYDKAYEYGFSRMPREIAFEGDWNACKQWIPTQFD